MTPVRLIAFPGAPNLPIFAAEEQGYFADAGIDLVMETTPSSAYQIQHLVKGEFDIAGTAFDNIVAYQEGQGAAKLDREPDLFAFMGATQIELAFVVAPEVKSYSDLKGRTIALDALATGFAFVLYEMLERAGLAATDYTMVPVGATPQRWESVKSGEHAGTITIEPFTSIARANGFSVLQTSSEILDAYQGGSFAASRAWAAANPERITGFIRAYLAGLAWTLDPANREAGAALLQSRMPQIQPRAIDAVMTSLLSAQSGLTPGARILEDGVETVLRLRSKFGAGDTELNDPARYMDLSYLQSVS
jgi:ABC-type nitrate/sulfonate/bicarbonate transport system substrate-binding protein